MPITGLNTAPNLSIRDALLHAQRTCPELEPQLHQDDVDAIVAGLERHAMVRLPLPLPPPLLQPSLMTPSHRSTSAAPTPTASLPTKLEPYTRELPPRCRSAPHTSVTDACRCSYTFESPFYHVLNGFLRGTDRSKLVPYKSCVGPPLPPCTVP